MLGAALAAHPASQEAAAPRWVKKTLKKNGKVKVTAKVTFKPTGGTARTQSKKIKLIRRR